jgi:hypothetical protein
MMIKKKRDYLLRKVAGRLIKVDPDVFYNVCEKYSVYLNKDRIMVKSRANPADVCQLSRLTAKAQKGQIVDHINRDALDNRRENLRIVNARQSVLNRFTKSSTGYTGVCIKKDKGKNVTHTYYYARFRSGKKRLCFYSPFTPKGLILCALARDKFVLQAGDESYAPLNFPLFKNEPFKTFLLRSDLNEHKKTNSSEK